MEVARLSREEILAHAEGGKEEAKGSGSDSAIRHVWQASPPPTPESPYAHRIAEMIDACVAFDRDRFESMLAPLLYSLPADVACAQVLVPFLREIGDRWHRGEVSVAAEHFASNLVRIKLGTLFESLRRRGGSNRILCACPAGEQHELGLLMFALRAADQGWDVVYLGSNVPVEGLLDAIPKTQPSLIGLSITLRKDAQELFETLRDLRAELPAEIPILIGGNGILGREDVVMRSGCRVLDGEMLRQFNLDKRASS